MNDSVVVITGAASGLGLNLARRYAAVGARVFGISVEPETDARARLPAGTEYIRADVRDSAAMRAAVDKIHARAGRIDVVIANAGINLPKARVPDFERGVAVVEVNVIGVLNTVAPVIDIMRSQGHGQLVFLGSVAGLNGTPGTAIYGASKAAVLNLAEAFAIDLRAAGIHVTAIAPGFIKTPLTRDNRHSMPFLMTEDDACDRIKRAIDRRAEFVVIPRRLALISAVLRRLPRGAYRAFMRRDPLKMHHD